MGLDKCILFSYSIGEFLSQISAMIFTTDKQKIYNGLFKEIESSLEALDGWGSVEIFVQDGKVTQITRRAIRKIEHEIPKFAQETP